MYVVKSELMHWQSWLSQACKYIGGKKRKEKKNETVVNVKWVTVQFMWILLTSQLCYKKEITIMF